MCKEIETEDTEPLERNRRQGCRDIIRWRSQVLGYSLRKVSISPLGAFARAVPIGWRGQEPGDPEMQPRGEWGSSGGKRETQGQGGNVLRQESLTPDYKCLRVENTGKKRGYSIRPHTGRRLATHVEVMVWDRMSDAALPETKQIQAGHEDSFECRGWKLHHLPYLKSWGNLLSPKIGEKLYNYDIFIQRNILTH